MEGGAAVEDGAAMEDGAAVEDGAAAAEVTDEEGAAAGGTDEEGADSRTAVDRTMVETTHTEAAVVPAAGEAAAPASDGAAAVDETTPCGEGPPQAASRTQTANAAHPDAAPGRSTGFQPPGSIIGGGRRAA